MQEQKPVALHRWQGMFRNGRLEQRDAVGYDTAEREMAGAKRGYCRNIGTDTRIGNSIEDLSWEQMIKQGSIIDC